MNNLNYMRSAPIVSLDTLYARQYMVFAVMLLNTREKDGPMFQYLRTSFADDQDYMNFIAEIRARSIYDFNGVDVQSSDELLSCRPAQQKAGRILMKAGAWLSPERCVRAKPWRYAPRTLLKTMMSLCLWHGMSTKENPAQILYRFGLHPSDLKVTTSYNTSRTGDYEPTTYPDPAQQYGSTSASESGTMTARVQARTQIQAAVQPGQPLNPTPQLLRKLKPQRQS